MPISEAAFPASEKARPGWYVRAAGLALLTLAIACSPLRMLGPDRAVVTVGTKSVTIAAPNGFCIDPDSLQKLPDGVFILLTDCARLDEAGGEVPRAAMTVHLSRDGLFAPNEDRRATLDRLGDFLSGESGRQVLSRDGNAADVIARGTEIRDDTLFIYVSDKGGARLPGASANYWRGFTQIAGGLASLTVYGFDDQPLSRDQGLALVNALAVSLINANRTR